MEGALTPRDIFVGWRRRWRRCDVNQRDNKRRQTVISVEMKSRLLNPTH